MKVKDLIAFIEADGWIQVRQRGSRGGAGDLYGLLITNSVGPSTTYWC